MVEDKNPYLLLISLSVNFEYQKQNFLKKGLYVVFTTHPDKDDVDQVKVIVIVVGFYHRMTDHPEKRKTFRLCLSTFIKIQ